ncbi:hypothetical protein [Actinokineospora sp.]|uniref:hypothetical protein n=1 Tax=Actinokineospora sp. TaxID=1872133 RepID=UPI0040382B07
MLDDRNPVFREAVAPFEESRYRRRAAVAEIGDEFDKRAADLAKRTEDRDRADADLLAELRQRREDDKGDEAAKSWGPRADKSTLLTIGSEDNPAQDRDRPAPDRYPSPGPHDAAPIVRPAPEDDSDDDWSSRNWVDRRE